MRLPGRNRGWRYRLAGAAVLTALLTVGLPATAVQAAPPSAASVQSWYGKLTKVPHPSAHGCFTARYPTLAWQPARCATPPSIPMTPKYDLRPMVVGNGNDISAQAPSGFISQSSGTFENITNVTSESSPIANSGPPVNDAYTLQVNTNFFASTACAGSSNPSCVGWEQFIFANDGSSGYVFIQYWLIHYNTTCPAGWNQFSFSGSSEIYCWRNSPTGTGVPNQPIGNLGSLRLTGDATSTGDSATVLAGTTAYSAAGSNSVNAAAGWTTAEFNVFGYGGNSSGGGAATFNSGASLNVRNRITYGGTAAPICAAVGFTGETNNLNFAAPAPPVTPPGPAIIFLENTTGGAATNCAAASAIGDTHQRTFAGLLYDFQSSGDFVEARTGDNFEVQTRKASGAPIWPNASLNQSVATRMGDTTVAVCGEKSLFVDGKPTDLEPDASMHLDSGVDIHNLGNAYVVTDEQGNSLHVTTNPGYLNVDVGLGQWPTKVLGLLGNPDGNVKELEGQDGTRFQVPVAFDDLYQKFGASWRVDPKETLLDVCPQVEPGDPEKPFFAADLDKDIRARAEQICLEAKVSQEWLDTCELDVAVVGEGAAQAYVGLEPPVLNGNM